ncbi:MAG TPA: alpha/beta hydrolase [Kofleriaceae bacterium]|nr:alpha/beta hydrolase [Kofleriaceae bacterium]
MPALLASMREPEAAAERGTVLLLHGFTAGKESQRNEAHSLARQGYLAVTLDAVGHGERRYPDFEQRFLHQDEATDRAFFTIVEQGAAEIAGVIAALHEQGWARPGRVGGCGISMGGFTLFGAIVARCALDAVVTIVASPHWRHTDHSPHTQLDRYAHTPLLMQAAERDATVPPAPIRVLYEALIPRYAAAPDRLRYVEHAGEGHMFSAEAWHRAWDDALAWFDRFLRA